MVENNSDSENTQETEKTNFEASPKTIAYLEAMSQQAASLFEQATMYRHKHMVAKTNFSKELYGKKLKKTVKKLDRIMSLFSAIEQNKKNPSVEVTE